MVLFNVEYEVLSTGMTYTCKVVGTDENNVVSDLVSQVGQIKVLSICCVSDIHRVSRTIRQQIIENYLMEDTLKTKGRPRKI
jgi:hypothetical protein